jgi:hypothetical protein
LPSFHQVIFSYGHYAIMHIGHLVIMMVTLRKQVLSVLVRQALTGHQLHQSITTAGWLAIAPSGLRDGTSHNARAASLSP